MTFDLRAWAARHGFNGEQAGEALGVDRATFYRYCTQPGLPKWLVLACERLDDEWMPIETAPRDGTEFMSCDFEFYKETLCATFFDAECQWWMDFSHGAVRPTHWKHLPKNPATRKPGSQEK